MHLPLPRAKARSQELIVLCFLFSPLLRCGLIGIWAPWTLEAFASLSPEADVGKLSKRLTAKRGAGLGQAGILLPVGRSAPRGTAAGSWALVLGTAGVRCPAGLRRLRRSRVE